MAQPEPAADEPVYPPRPSRPARPERDVEAPSRIHAPFEPRSQRAYMPEPQDDPEHYGHLPPRPQARWLPDPEPGEYPGRSYPGADSGQPGDRRRAPVPRQGTDHTPDPYAGGDFDAPSRPSRPERPERYDRHVAWEPSGEVSAPGGDAAEREPQPSPVIDRLESALRRVQAQRPEARPYGGPHDEARPDRGSDDRSQASPDEFGRLGADAADRDEREPLPREYAMPQAGDAPDDSREAQPAEAVAGEDSVRDIWARLQAMGGQPPQGRAAARQSQAEPGIEAHQPKAALPYAVAPWEQLELYGAVPSLLNTVKNILLKPGDFFDQLPPFSGRIRPLLFANVVCLVSMIFGLIWFRFGLGPNLSDLGRTDGFQGLGAGMLGSLAWLGLSPILVTAFVFLDAALGHLLLGLLRSASKPFEETFRTVCYAGAPWMLTVLPVSWQYLIPIVLIWHMTLQAIGLKKLHQAGYPQVLASVLVKWSLYFMASFAVLHVLLTRR